MRNHNGPQNLCFMWDLDGESSGAEIVEEGKKWFRILGRIGNYRAVGI